MSLRINLFFLRIMKEHAVFIGTALPPVNHDLIEEAKVIHQRFYRLLSRTVSIAVGQVDIGEDAVTPFTLRAEKISSRLTGFPIATEITAAMSELSKKRAAGIVDLSADIRTLNKDAAAAVRDIIRYKTKVINAVAECKMFIFIYPLELQHIRREALAYLDILENLQNGLAPALKPDFPSRLLFWSDIMKEHAEFTGGLLDPTEKALIKEAHRYAAAYRMLINEEASGSKKATETEILTADFKEFNKESTDGLINCSIKSIILPLLADHLLREANHFFRVLKETTESN